MNRRGDWLLVTGFWFLLIVLQAGLVDGQPRAAIRGLVTDADGQPLASVRVGVIDQETAVMHEVLTDASGRFQVENLAADRLYRVVATKYGYLAYRRDDVLPGGEELVIRLKLQQERPRRTAPLPPDPSAESEGEEVVKLATRLVVLNVSVKDSRGNPVLDLEQDHFTVLEDGAPQEIVYFDGNAPLSGVLLIDTSSSMQGSPLQEAQRAAREFLDHSNPHDEIALLAFNDQVRVLKGFTRDHPEVRAAIDQLTASGGTALYDAIVTAIELLQGSHTKRHAIVLLSDGQDEDSRKRFSDIEQLMRSTDTVLFAVGEYGRQDRKLFLRRGKYYKQPALDVNLNPVWVLRQMADLSGGGAFFPEPGQSLASLFSLIARELRHQYVLGYNSPDHPGPRFRSIEVRVKRARRQGPLKVRTRTGYVRD